jgi:CRP/FNR family transcriptional regulator, cyclic AMP receptor protein
MKTTTSKAEIEPEPIGASDALDCLNSSGVAKSIGEYQQSQTVYSQGESAETIFYIQRGSIKLSVVSSVGKEAVVAILAAGDFFGEWCLAGQNVRSGTATAITAATLLVIEKQEMLRALHAEHELSDCFVSYMLARNIRIEQDLIDQLFNSSEKRLARTLLQLARYGRQDKPQRLLPKIPQETLAEMVGTTRSRVNFFMNKFKKRGFVKYNSGGIHIDPSLLSVVQRD